MTHLYVYSTLYTYSTVDSTVYTFAHLNFRENPYFQNESNCRILNIILCRQKGMSKQGETILENILNILEI